MKFLLLFLISFNIQASMYLKLDGETIVGHAYSAQGEYVVRIDDTRLVNSDGDYKYKYTNQLVLLSSSEIALHPNKVERNRLVQKHQDRRDITEVIKDFDCSVLNGFVKLLCRERKR